MNSRGAIRVGWVPPRGAFSTRRRQLEQHAPHQIVNEVTALGQNQRPDSSPQCQGHRPTGRIVAKAPRSAKAKVDVGIAGRTGRRTAVGMKRMPAGKAMTPSAIQDRKGHTPRPSMVPAEDQCGPTPVHGSLVACCWRAKDKRLLGPGPAYLWRVKRTELLETNQVHDVLLCKIHLGKTPSAMTKQI